MSGQHQLTNGQIMDIVAEGTRRAGILAYWERRAVGEDPDHPACKEVERRRAALEDWREQPAEGGRIEPMEVPQSHNGDYSVGYARGWNAACAAIRKGAGS